MCDKTNPETALECFQISLNILETRNLIWRTAHSRSYYVVVMLGKEKYRTSVKNKIGEQCCREYLLFEWYTTLDEMKRSSLTLAVMEPRFYASSRLLGKTKIDLGVIWAQPHHQVFHKWARLCLPRNRAAGTVGLLKMDVSIIYRGHIQFIPSTVSSDNLEKNFPPVSEQQIANYVVSVYNGFCITLRPQEQGQRRQQKVPNTFVKVSFSGISARTARQGRTSNPSYCERISISKLFPNTCNTIRFEVCSTVRCLNPVLATVDLNLEKISYDGENGFVPTFGPSLLHMYGNSASGSETPGGEGPFYRGALLIALKVIIPYCQQHENITNVESIAPIPMDTLWAWEDFCIYCPVLEVSMLDRKFTDKACGVALTIGEIPYERSESEEFMLLKAEIKNKKFYYTGPIATTQNEDPYRHLNFTNAFPVLQHATRLPGFRFRIYRNNLMQRIAESLENALRDVVNRLEHCRYSNPRDVLDDLNHAVDVTAKYIQMFFENVHYFNPCAENHYDYSTDLDQKQLALQKEELEKIYHQIKDKINFNSTDNLMKLIGKTSNQCCCVSKKKVKMLIFDSITFTQKLKNLSFKSVVGWPDIVIWLLSEGSRFAFHKICTSDVIFSEIPELSGKDCGRIQTIYMKPLKCRKHQKKCSCTCIAGKIELFIWMGLHSQVSCLNSYIPQGFYIKRKDYDMCLKAPFMEIKCRVFIYRAKLMFSEIMTPNSFVRINIFNSIRDTQIQEMTSVPVWDQVLKINCIVRTSQERMAASPPEILVEVYHKTLLGQMDFIGRAKIQPSIGSKLHTECPPALTWHDLYNGLECTGKLFMSALIELVPETLVKSTIYSSINEGSARQNTLIKVLDDDEIEEIPQCLKPKSLVYKVDIYWWGLRNVNINKKTCALLEIDDLIVKSDVITETKSNCNFPSGRISQTFEGNLNAYSFPFIVKLCDSGTFGRTILLNKNAEKNPRKFLVDWLSKCERETSVASASFLSCDFQKINKTLFVKKSSVCGEVLSKSSKSAIGSTVDHKWCPIWRILLCRRKPDKEKNTLLPLHVSHIYQNSQNEERQYEVEIQDWWSRFYYSQKVVFDDCCGNRGKIKIFSSELEQQPEYEKFKDWCSSLKLYKGKKTGVPNKDKELRCGVLKVGIAIYRWPPPPDTVAVNYCGVELQRGFFDDFPCNNPSKYLVRVYIVRALNLALKDCFYPYVVIKYGRKQCGDRNQCLPRTTNPIIGRTYEFRCSLPDDYLLTVSMYNHDTMGHDVLIGSTNIDLENRIYSKHRGRVGLSAEYKVTGVGKWRDIEKPSDILVKLCAKNNMSPPVFPDSNAVIINGIEYRDADKTNKTYISASERKENICLNLLHKWNTLPICGYHLVPEHVETRHLTNPENPNIEQGKILMWVDIFPLESGAHLPVPVDISPPQVEDYELRIIIWNVRGLKHESFTSKRGLDLYVRAWIGNVEQASFTDVHYNVINGDATFNWRMIFNFQYQHSDKKMILMEKDPFTEFEERLPPILVVEVLNSDAESLDDYLAILCLDLNSVPRGSKTISSCISCSTESTKKTNLFSIGSLRSWWPLKTFDPNTGNVKLQGMIDLELHLLSKDKAMLTPVGIGRDPPFPLPAPDRPESKKLESESESCGVTKYFVLFGILLLTLFAVYSELDISIYKINCTNG